MPSSSASSRLLQQQPTSSSSTAPDHSTAIRRMLKEQKRHCSSLHANPLFQEFWHRSKPPQDAQPPVIDDLEAEGQTRLFDVIRSAAEAREANPAGVWASFGQPYACLGQPQQLDTSAAALLPHLNRDDIAAAAAAPSNNKQQQQQSQRRGNNRFSRTGSAGPSPGVVAAAAAAALAATAAVAGDGKPHTAATAASNGNSSSKQADAAKLLQHKSVMHFSTVDRLEAAFPSAAVRQADRRQRAAKVQPQRFFDKSRADADLADAAASYGHHTLPSKALAGHKLVQHHQKASAAAAAHAASAASRDTLTTGDSKHRASKPQADNTTTAAAAAPVGDGSQAFFITQQAPAGSVTAAGAGARRISVSMSAEQPEGAAGHARRSSAHTAGQLRESTTAAEYHHYEAHRQSTTTMHSQHDQEHAPAEPHFGPLTEPTMQPLGGGGNSSSPVIAWHNEFVGVRHAGYSALQQTLRQRSQDRAAARGEAGTGAHFSRSLMQQLGQAGGRFPGGWIPGTCPESPFVRATTQQHQQQAASAAALAAEAAAAANSRPPMKPAEVELLEQFYSSLCSLVERQRLSDPLSLTLVHKVKSLLEGGTFLQPAMLQACVDCVFDFSSSCGLLNRHNRFILPLLTFVRKCTGVCSQEFEAMVEAAGVAAVLYKQQQHMPSVEHAGGLHSQQQEGTVSLQQQQQLSGIPEDADGCQAGSVGAADPADDSQAQQLELQLQHCSININRSSGHGGSRPQSALSAAAPAHMLNPEPPATSPARASEASGLGLRLDAGCSSPTTAAVGGPTAGHSPGPATARGRSSSGSNGIAGGGAGSLSGCGTRGLSGSGASTSRSRAASSPGGGGRSGGATAAAAVLEGPTVPAINAAAAAAAAEIVQAIQTAPASQRALAAAAGGSAVLAAAAGDAADGVGGAGSDGSIRVKVPGVAGPVKLVSAQAAAAAAAAAASAAAALAGPSAAEGGGASQAKGSQQCCEEALPDLGCDVDGQPLSRRLRHQEGLAEWTGVAASTGNSGCASGGGIVFE